MRNLLHRFIGDAVVMYEPYDLIQRGRQRALTSLGSRRRQPPGPRPEPPQDPAQRAKLQDAIAKADAQHSYASSVPWLAATSVPEALSRFSCPPHRPRPQLGRPLQAATVWRP
jgi:hypothetical protein